jgi:hypothetical protein
MPGMKRILLLTALLAAAVPVTALDVARVK